MDKNNNTEIHGINKKSLAALSTDVRPSRPSGLAASLTFGWRALLKIKYIPEQLFDITMFPIMFLLMYTYLFGGAIAGSISDYLQYLLPGILVMTVVMITMYTGMELNNDIRKGIFDRFRSLPIWRPSILVGALLIDAVRYTMASAVMITLGLVLGFRPDGGVTGMVLAVMLLVLFSFSMSWIWTVLGLVLRSEKSLMSVSMMILFPLTFISNVFIDPLTLPPWLQAFVKVNPISILVTAVRGLTHGTATFQQAVVVILISAGMIVIFAPFTMFLFNRKQ